MPKQYTVTDLGKAVKKKHAVTGAYKDIDDAVLGRLYRRKKTAYSWVTDDFETPITVEQVPAFNAWKAKYAPEDSGEDYDLRGAFLAGETADQTKGVHGDDKWKKPNHPTFSIYSIYATHGKPGTWEGDTYIPYKEPGAKPSPLGAVTGTVPTVMTPDVKTQPAPVGKQQVAPVEPDQIGTAGLAQKAARLVGVSPKNAARVANAVNWLDPVSGVANNMREAAPQALKGLKTFLNLEGEPFSPMRHWGGGGVDIAEAAMQAGEKPGMAAAVAAGGVPMALAGVGGGIVGTKAGERVARALGADEDTSRVAGLLAGLGAGGWGANKFKRSIYQPEPGPSNWYGTFSDLIGPKQKPPVKLVPGTTTTKTPSGKVTVTIGKGGKTKEVPVDQLTDAQRDAKIAENQKIIDELTAKAKAAADKNAAIESSKAKGKAKTGTTTSIEEINAKIAAKKAAEAQAAGTTAPTAPPVVEPPVTPSEPSRWDILDPDGEIVETTASRAEAEAAIAESGGEGYTIREVPNEPPPIVPETPAPVVPEAPAVLSTPLEKVVAEPPVPVTPAPVLETPLETAVTQPKSKPVELALGETVSPDGEIIPPYRAPQPSDPNYHYATSEVWQNLGKDKPVETATVESLPVEPPVIPPVEPPVIPPVKEVVTAPIVEPPIVPPVIPPAVTPAAPPILSTPLEAAVTAPPVVPPVVTPTVVTKPRNRAEKRAAKAAAEAAKGGKPKFSIAEMTPPETPVTPPVTPPAPILATPLEAAISATPPNPALLQRVSTALGFGEYPKLRPEDKARVDKLAASKGFTDKLPEEPPEPMSMGMALPGVPEMFTKKSVPRIVNLDTMRKGSEATVHKLRGALADALAENEIEPGKHKVRTEKMLREGAAKMGLDVAQYMVQLQKTFGSQFEIAGLKVREAINTLASESVKLEEKLNAADTPEGDKATLKLKLHQVEYDLANLSNSLVGSPTEHGRNLQALKYIADNNWDYTHWLNKTKRYNQGMLDKKQIQAIKTVIETGREAEKKGDTAAAEAAKAKLVDIAGDALKKNNWDLLSDSYKSGILSSPTVHMANVVGTGAKMLGDQLSRIPATALDALRAKITGGERTRALPDYAKVFSEWRSKGKNDPLWREALQEAQNKWEQRAATVSGPIRTQIYNKLINPVFDALGWEDNQFKTLAFDLSLSEQAKVQALNDSIGLKKSGKPVPKGYVDERRTHHYENPSENMQKKAVEDAQIATLNNENILSAAISGAKGMVTHYGDKHDQQQLARGLLFTGDLFQPFTKVPTNLVGTTLDYTLPQGKMLWHGGSALVKGVRNAANRTEGQTIMQALASGMEPKHIQGFTDAAAKGTIGAMIPMAMFYYAKEGKAIPMSVQNDPAELARVKAKGASPGSVSIGGYWNKLNPFGPFAAAGNVALDVYADFKKEHPNDADSLGKFMAYYYSHPHTIAAKAIPSAIMDLPVFKSMKDFLRVVEGKGEGWKKFAANKLTSIPPYTGAINETVSFFDKSMRNVESEGLFDTIMHSIQTKTGAGRGSLPAMIDPRGRDIPSAPWNPLRSAPDLSDEVTRQADRLKAPLTLMPFRPAETVRDFEERATEKGLPPRGFDGDETDKQYLERAAAEGLKPATFTKDEHILFQQLTAHLGSVALDELVNSERFKGALYGKQQDMWEQERAKVSKAVRAFLGDDQYQSLNKEERIALLMEGLKAQGLR